MEVTEAEIGDYLAVDADFLIKKKLPTLATIGELLAHQKKLQAHMLAAKPAYTGRGVTVGLELEFLMTAVGPANRSPGAPECDSNLHGLVHIEIAKTEQTAIRTAHHPRDRLRRRARNRHAADAGSGHGDRCAASRHERREHRACQALGDPVAGERQDGRPMARAGSAAVSTGNRPARSKA